ncbi:hypothetical protein VQ01_08595 [Tamlana sp. s12]|nr:hypothetical protein VQ01_08595 [Tamlana sp. s12]
MKYSILALLQNRQDFNYTKFVESLPKNKRTDIQCLNNSNSLKILATAAPLCYAKIIAEKEGFNYCIATEFTNVPFSGDFENVSLTKKRNVLDFLEAQGLKKIDVFITDHLDDLPLIKVSNQNVVVQPYKEFLEVLNQENISFRVIS